MCGIAGYLSFSAPIAPFDDEPFHRVLKYRGPDYHGERTIETDFLFGKLHHYRLSIIDLDSRSNQPFKSASGKSEIVFNGEIYNFLTIKNDLQSKGYQFKTNSDTEVILLAYEVYGIEKLVQSVDGMFAFALLDYEKKLVYLVRDPFGKKPLYYHWNEKEKKLVFSSDIRSFEKFPMQLSVSDEALAYFFCELSTPEQQSIYQQVKKIQAGSYTRFDVSGEKTARYFSLSHREKLNVSREEIVRESERLLEAAVKKRLISDVGVSAFLSGGIDSSLVVALMAKNSSKAIKTYTVGYSDKTFDESGYAQKVAQKWNTDHTQIFLDDLSEKEMETIFEECGEPFADSSILPSAIICKAISKHEKVALSGDGGDEVFAGYYEHYFTSRLDKYTSKQMMLKVLQGLNKVGFRTSKTTFANELLQYGFNQPEYHLLHRRNMGFSPSEVGQLVPGAENYVNAEFVRIWQNARQHSSSQLSAMMNGSFHTRLINDYLVKMDRASMMNGLEVRSPFLDKDLVKFASQIPDEQLIWQGIPKSITKEIAKKYLPVEDIHRTKMGFGVPIGEWFRNRLKDYFQEAFGKGGFAQNKMTEKYLKRHLAGENHTDKLVTLLVFHLWNRRRVS